MLFSLEHTKIQVGNTQIKCTLYIQCILGLTNGQSVEIIPKERIVKKFINDTYFVSCTLSDDSTSPVWINPKGQKIDGSTQSRIGVDTSNGADLFINQIASQDDGLYTCLEPKGNRASFHLSVIRPIVFDTSLAEQTAVEGQTYTMKCSAQGHSQPRIFWKVDQRKPPEPKYKIMRDGLMIHNVSKHDAYRHYLCRALDIISPIPDTKVMNITLTVVENVDRETTTEAIETGDSSSVRNVISWILFIFTVGFDLSLLQ
ncbi:Inactive tyrosine-protein kinase 7 [Orchesella cincta]|uniref:Inactive tyrosine-protein kinase 7 n=1 Tax=Orchesella cincta TaxID=48709 RepID=A0A1D2NBU0_ORCCI|nr:Inactive tyrosine-protein kinase 7 [Orchesella cincta]